MKPCDHRPIVISETIQEFLGFRYHLTKKKNQSIFKSTNPKKARLHRAVWRYFSGEEIPEGCVIHHEDGDQLNNQYENLVCVEAIDHSEFHAWHYLMNVSIEEFEFNRQKSIDGFSKFWESLSVFEREDFSRRRIESGLEKRRAWHRSPEGRDFHKRCYHEKIKPSISGCILTCLVCGSPFIGIKNSKVCSEECRIKRRKSYDRNRGLRRKKRTCVHCGKTFYGHSNRRYCSDECKYNKKFCPACGKEFTGPPLRVYCSKQCQVKLANFRVKERKLKQSRSK